MKTLKIFLLFLSTSTAFAHLGSIVGKVTDAQTKQPIRGVNISLVGHNRGVITDESGYFQLNNLAAAPYKVEVSFMGYVAQNQNIIVKEDQASTIEFSLKKR